MSNYRVTSRNFLYLARTVPTERKFFLVEKLINAMRVCLACYKMVARYENGRILCQSRGFIQSPCFCDEYSLERKEENHYELDSKINRAKALLDYLEDLDKHSGRKFL